MEGFMKQMGTYKFYPIRRRELNFAHTPCHFPWRSWLFSLACLEIFLVIALSGANASESESVLRTIVQVNADQDMVTMAGHMSHEKDAISYSIGDRKYVGWDELAGNKRSEFGSAARLKTHISDLHVWAKGGVAWLAMERDYIRHITTGSSNQRMVFYLQETGVVECHAGRWILVSWHGSPCGTGVVRAGVDSTYKNSRHQTSDTQPSTDSLQSYDLSGEWEILEIEDNRTYRAVLDRQGNGPYTWQGGQFRTTSFTDRRWQGTWKQTGNDREGEFELVLSEDETEAKGIWWYLRVGTSNNIPPRQHGGSYVWKRLNSSLLAQ